MPTLAEIEELDEGPLTDLEKEMVRQIVGISGKADSFTFAESDARMMALTSSQNQVVRGLLIDYDDIGLDTLMVAGGSKGANLSTPRDKEAIANELRRMLYPSTANDNPGTSTYTPAGSISIIPVTYLVGDQDGFE